MTNKAGESVLVLRGSSSLLALAVLAGSATAEQHRIPKRTRHVREEKPKE